MFRRGDASRRPGEAMLRPYQHESSRLSRKCAPQELPRVLKELYATLKPNGVLFSSNPRGENEEGWSGERYGVFYNLERWRELVTSAGFVEIAHYYRPPGLPREQQPWLASLWRK